MKRLVLLVSIFTILLTLTACKQDSITFELLSDPVVYMETGTIYADAGFLARDGYTDLSEYVTSNANIDIYTSGDYEFTYTLDYNGETRQISRQVYYREPGCEPVPDTDLTVCTAYWSQYLHTSIKLTTYYQGDTFHDTMSIVFDNVETLLYEYHILTTKYDAFEGIENVYAINEDPTTTHTIDSRLFDIIQFSLDHQPEVDNLFNIALGPVLKIWHNYREACNSYTNPVCEVPLMADLLAANAYTDPSKIVLDDVNKTITMEANMAIDLGGVSKGYISGEIIEYLDAQGLYGYLFNNGTSNISIGGTHPTRDNGSFMIAITDPSGSLSYYALLYLDDGEQLVTSGDYQQYFVVDGELYHHIINPVTLMPERNSRSVSIVYSDPALADLYSTAIFTMSIEDGLDFVNGIDGLEAIWYTVDDTAVMSDNFRSDYLVDLLIPED